MRLDTVHLLPNYIDVNICSCRDARLASILVRRDISAIKFASCGLEDRDLPPSKDRPLCLHHKFRQGLEPNQRSI
jgi:hypothetical protein